MARPPKLDEAAIAEALAALPSWTLESASGEGGELVRRYEFGAYAHGALFASGVALLSDRLDHHPDLLLTYRKVEIRLSTHDAGGLTVLDFNLAAQIEKLFSSS